jgi:dephospho-CoA kinase
MFKQLGINVVDADLVAREVVTPNSPALKAIAQYFGAEFILANGQLDRAKLRSKVFSDNKNKLWLNNLLHPLIRQSITEQLQQSQSPYCLLVAPLLIENKLTKLVNRVLVVDIDEEQQITRTLQRDSSSENEIKSIMASQLSRAERLRNADDIIDNNKQDMSLVLQQVKTLDHTYQELSKTNPPPSLFISP